MKRRALIQRIAGLQQITPRADWVSATRDILMAEIRRQGQVSSVATPALETMASEHRFWESFVGVIRQPVFSFVAALVLALTSGLTVNAAFYSLPGEPLYRLKIVFERTQLAMVGDSARKVELKVEFARNRVKELEKLVANVTSGFGTRTEFSHVVSRFTSEVASVQQELKNLPSDQRAVFKIAVSVDRAGNELAERVLASDFSGSGTEQPAIAQAVRQALATAAATSQTALETALATPVSATSSQPLPAAEVGQYLQEKIDRLQLQGEQLLSHMTTTTPAALKEKTVAIDPELDVAKLLVSSGDFQGALTKITAAKDVLEAVQVGLDAISNPKPDDSKPVENSVNSATTTPSGKPEVQKASTTSSMITSEPVDNLGKAKETPKE